MTDLMPDDATVLHEPSAWLRATAERRIRLVRRLGFDPDAADPVVLTSLTEPPNDPGERQRWEMSCDRCATQVSSDHVLHLAVYRPHRGVALTLGLCRRCLELEVVTG